MLNATSDADGWLIGDIGATTSRCAQYRPHSRQRENIRIYHNDDFADPGSLLRDYLDGCDSKPRLAALAVAGPVYGDEVRMINRNWSFSGKSLSSELSLAGTTIVNDFHAVAFALPAMNDDTRTEIGRATEYRDGNMAVLGPGSGLGMAAWIRNDSAGVAMTGEGGHVTVAGRNDDEDRIISWFRKRYGHCSAERILSGPGLLALHEAMHGIALDSPERITGNAKNSDCGATMNQFFSFLGGVAADLALVTGAFGGLYIAGGIVPAQIGELQKSPFRERFEEKNRYTEYMKTIPTYVITDPLPGLTGLAMMISRG